MNLVAPLICGFRGAENGTVEFYERGTATPATVYSDFYAKGVLPSGAQTLDANGRGSFYVAGMVDVVVYDFTSNEVARFVWGLADAGIEVQSSAFTGTDYDTAETAAGKPLTVEDAFAKWMDSAGATDWRVLQNGTATLLRNAILPTSYFNVKSPLYGAEGDGATDDTAAIQAAATAALTAGGGVVYFPRGNYRVTADLSFDESVFIYGDGPEISKLSLGSSASIVFSRTVPPYPEFAPVIRDISICNYEVSTKALISGDATNLTLLHARLGDLSGDVYTTGPVVDVDGSAITAVDCSFRSAADDRILRNGTSGVVLYASQCKFYGGSDGTDHGLLILSGGSVASCVVRETDGASTLSDYAIEVTDEAVSVVGCTLNGAIAGFKIANDVAAFTESGNAFVCVTRYNAYSLVNPAGRFWTLEGKKCNQVSLSLGTTGTIDTRQAVAVFVTITASGSAIKINMPADVEDGSWCHMTVYNGSGAPTGSITVGYSSVTLTTVGVIAAGHSANVSYYCYTNTWRQASPQVDV